MARNVLNKPEQKSAQSKSSSQPQAANPETQTAVASNQAPTKKQKPRASKPVMFQKIQNDELTDLVQRVTQPAPEPDNDPVEALSEPAGRVHYFQQADRALAKAEGGTYTPKRAEQEYADDADELEGEQQPDGERSSDNSEVSEELSEDIAQKLADKLAPLQRGQAQPEQGVEPAKTQGEPTQKQAAKAKAANKPQPEQAGTQRQSPGANEDQPQASQSRPALRPIMARALGPAKTKPGDQHEVVSKITQRIQGQKSGEQHELVTDPNDEARPAPAADLRVCDLMTRDIVCVTEDVRLEQLGSLFIERGLTAMPVVNHDSHKLVGLMTLADLFSQAYSEDTLAALQSDDAQTSEQARAMLAQPVRQLMQSDVLQVEPECTVQDACRLMTEHHVHHLVVTRNQVVKGMFTSFDAMQVLAGQQNLSRPSKVA